MEIQKIILLPAGWKAEQVHQWFNEHLFAADNELFAKWEGLSGSVSFRRVPGRDTGAQSAYWVKVMIGEDVFPSLLSGFSAEDARFIFIGSLLEHGWETVPKKEDIAYLYGEYVDGDLHSALKFDGKIRRYQMRTQLMPNINRRFTRFVVLYPDIVSYIQEANSNFPRQCYVLSRVITRIAGRMDDIDTIARLNGVALNDMEDYITLMEKIAGKQVTLSHGTFQLDPILMPVIVGG